MLLNKKINFKYERKNFGFNFIRHFLVKFYCNSFKKMNWLTFQLMNKYYQKSYNIITYFEKF